MGEKGRVKVDIFEDWVWEMLGEKFKECWDEGENLEYCYNCKNCWKWEIGGKIF